MEIEYRRAIMESTIMVTLIIFRFLSPVTSIIQTLPAKVLEQWVEATREVRVLVSLRASLLFAFCALPASKTAFVGRGEQACTAGGNTSMLDDACCGGR